MYLIWDPVTCGPPSLHTHNRDWKKGTPTKRQVSKRQVSKRQVSKRLVSKHLKRQAYKTSVLQNVRFTKCQVFKTSGCKKTSISVLYLWLVEIRRFCCSLYFRGLFCHVSPWLVISKNDTPFTLNRNANLAIPIILFYKYFKFETGHFDTRRFKTWRFVNLTFWNRTFWNRTFWNRTFWNLTFCGCTERRA